MTFYAACLHIKLIQVWSLIGSTPHFLLYLQKSLTSWWVLRAPGNPVWKLSTRKPMTKILLERECSLTFQGNMYFVHWVCLNQTIYHILHLNTEILQTRILTCMVIFKSLLTFWCSTHCLREIFLKDAHTQKKTYIADHAETIKRCVNGSGKMSSNCEIWKEKDGLSEPGDAAQWLEFGSSLARELTSLLPLDFGRWWWGEAMIQDSDIPALWITCHGPLFKPCCPWTSFFSPSYNGD